ncbi:hypothetical protein [Flagellimonas nanhaiensis]|uniref:Uncharacterized protein n=1 Tax=Flagellimonas nanhaiensis TaxID=2292706 RepID=A0A371JLE5_9FLAO|nr:hypothetical protein [Allomuricauda nanhaiensis]RDY57773.1 hypothetical protein DX873_17915 [Allomuricauda nanhaiensis]
MKNVLFIALACLLSCKAQKENLSSSGNEMEDLELIAQDGYSGILEYDAQIIRDTKSLNKFYGQINKTRKPGLPVPKIDFSKEMVLVLCLGEQKGDRAPLLSKAEESESSMTILVGLADQKDQKDQKDQNLQVVSYPFYLYKMPLNPKAINFSKSGW